LEKGKVGVIISKLLMVHQEWLHKIDQRDTNSLLKDKIWHLCKHHKLVNTKGKERRKPRKEGEFLPGSDQIWSSEQDPIEKDYNMCSRSPNFIAEVRTQKS